MAELGKVTVPVDMVPMLKQEAGPVQNALAVTIMLVNIAALVCLPAVCLWIWRWAL